MAAKLFKALVKCRKAHNEKALEKFGNTEIVMASGDYSTQDEYKKAILTEIESCDEDLNNWFSPKITKITQEEYEKIAEELGEEYADEEADQDTESLSAIKEDSEAREAEADKLKDSLNKFVDGDSNNEFIETSTGEVIESSVSNYYYAEFCKGFPLIIETKKNESGAWRASYAWLADSPSMFPIAQEFEKEINAMCKAQGLVVDLLIQKRDEQTEAGFDPSEWFNKTVKGLGGNKAEFIEQFKISNAEAATVLNQISISEEQPKQKPEPALKKKEPEVKQTNYPRILEILQTSDLTPEQIDKVLSNAESCLFGMSEKDLTPIYEHIECMFDHEDLTNRDLFMSEVSVYMSSNKPKAESKLSPIEAAVQSVIDDNISRDIAAPSLAECMEVLRECLDPNASEEAVLVAINSVKNANVFKVPTTCCQFTMSNGINKDVNEKITANPKPEAKAEPEAKATTEKRKGLGLGLKVKKIDFDKSDEDLKKEFNSKNEQKAEQKPKQAAEADQETAPDWMNDLASGKMEFAEIENDEQLDEAELEEANGDNDSDFNAKLSDLNQRINALKAGEVLVIDELDDEVYHAADGISSSQLKTAIESLMKYKAKYIDNALDDDPEARQKRFNIGKLFHAMTLEPHKVDDGFCLLPKDFVKPTKPQQDKYNAWVKAGKPSKEVAKKDYPTDLMMERCGFLDKFELKNRRKIQIERSDWDKCEAMAAAIRSDKDTKPFVTAKEKVCETSYFKRDEETGLLIKCRPDMKIATIICDAKSIEMQAQPNERYLINKIKYKIRDLGYHVSAAMYLDIVPDAQQWVWLFANKTNGYHWAAAIRANPTGDLMRDGQALYREYLLKIAECLNTGDFPKPSSVAGYTDENEKYILPTV